jgi:transposase
MSRPRAHPLRPLEPAERAELERVARSGSDRADRVSHAVILLAVADGAAFLAAAQRAGRRSRRAVAALVARFNATGLAALGRRHGGGPAIQYGPADQERILHEFRRTPDRARDGTGTWSLTTLQRALRTAPDGLPTVSTVTILHTLWRAGYTWQQSRTWCQTGTVVRKRRAGPVTVTDPDTAPKKS